MKTITNIKRRAKNSIKQRKQRKYKTHKNKHTKTQLKQRTTHRGGRDNQLDRKTCFQKNCLPPKNHNQL